MALQPFVGPWSPLQVRNLCYTVGRTPWTSDQPVARPLLTQDSTKTINTQRDIHACVGFKPTILAFERPNRVRALDRVAIVIGSDFVPHPEFSTRRFGSWIGFRPRVRRWETLTLTGSVRKRQEKSSDCD
jgi:hypothetical protein